MQGTALSWCPWTNTRNDAASSIAGAIRSGAGCPSRVCPGWRSSLTSPLVVPVRRFEALSKAQHDILVVAADANKEDLLLAALPYIKGIPKVIVAGYGHLTFRDELFHEELDQLLVPSLANGYPNTLTHLYQCLTNAARLGINGAVAEFGMFKGGTTMFLSRIIEKLGMDWLVIGFDTFGGFPPRRSPLDMYDHPDCTFADLSAVKRYLDGRNIEIVVGDIVETCNRLNGEELVLSFIDTDNYNSARAALEVRSKDRPAHHLPSPGRTTPIAMGPGRERTDRHVQVAGSLGHAVQRRHEPVEPTATLILHTHLLRLPQYQPMMAHE